jgi:hypothetical protein
MSIHLVSICLNTPFSPHLPADVTTEVAPPTKPHKIDKPNKVVDVGFEARTPDFLVDTGIDVSGPRSCRNSDMAVTGSVMPRSPMNGGVIGSVDVLLWCVTYTFYKRYSRLDDHEDTIIVTVSYAKKHVT